MFSVDDVSEHSDIVDNEEADGASLGDEDNDEELEGAVGGAMLFSTPERQESQESPNPERSKTSLLDELQKEIDRLHLLNPGGMCLQSSTYLLPYTSLSPRGWRRVWNLDPPIGEWVQWNPALRTSVHNGQFCFPRQKDRQLRFTDTGYLCIVYLFCDNRANCRHITQLK